MAECLESVAPYIFFFFFFVFLTTYFPLIYHTQTHTHTHEWKKSYAFRSMSFHCHFSSSFWRDMFYRSLFPLSPPFPCTNKTLFWHHAHKTSFHKSNINMNVICDDSKFTVSFTCHLFFDLLICNQIFLNYGFHGFLPSPSVYPSIPSSI